MGWGAALYALACLMLLAYGLARLGACKGDVFVVGAILLRGRPDRAVRLLSGALHPCLRGARQRRQLRALAVRGRSCSAPSIWGLDCVSGARSCGVAWNTVAEAILVGVLTTLLGLAFALVALRTRLPMKPLLRVLSILPIITPPFVIGLALILLFGRAGIVTIWLADLFDIPRSRWIYGMPGITIAQVLAFTPIAMLVLLGVLQGVAPSLEEASQTLRASRWHTFRTVTWPLIRPGLANAFLIGFIESMADFANPLVIGGNFNVLSTDIFFAVVGASHDQGRAAVLAIVLLAFTLTAFLRAALLARPAQLRDRRRQGRRRHSARRCRPACARPATPSIVPWLRADDRGLRHDPGRRLRRLDRPRQHADAGILLTAFSIETRRRRLVPLRLGVELVHRHHRGRADRHAVHRGARHPDRVAAGPPALPRPRARFEFLAMMSFAIPGTVIGVSYILAFNVPPVSS